MTRRIILSVVTALVLNHLLLGAQSRVYRFGGLNYSFPSAQGSAASVLNNDGNGNLSWGSGIPVGLIAFGITGTCPTGWAEYTPARGRMIVGLVSGGTAQGQVGTSLTDTENRAVGQHNHPGSINTEFTDGGHGHTVNDPTHTHGGNQGSGSPKYNAFDSDKFYLGSVSASGAAATGITVNNATTGIGVNSISTTVDNAGATAGTNAPYIQFIACQKQ